MSDKELLTESQEKHLMDKLAEIEREFLGIEYALPEESGGN